MVNVTSIYGPINTSFNTAIATALASNTNIAEADIIESNEIYRPSIGVPYTKSYLLPIEHTDRDVLGPEFWETFEGLYQISVFAPAGRKTTVADSIVDSIIAGFVSGDLINTGEFNLRIIRSWRIDSIEESDWYQTPIRIRWSAEIPRELS